jgi:protein-S-isoprenylcysteine O-methyltransferase Ste14
MIALDLPQPLLWALRWLLFLGPLAVALYLGLRVRHDRRTLIGCLFAFLYGLGLIFATHSLAIAVGWWHYGGTVLMLNGIPADIWIGGAILFGPVLYLAFPSTAPFWLTLPIVVLLHGTLFSSLRPLVYGGQDWFAGVALVFAVAHIPAIYLARWTSKDQNLAYRVTLLAIGYGFLAFMVLPALIMHAMGERLDLTSRPLPLIAACMVLIGIFFVIGFSAVQLFAVHGKGTPIPLDPTKRLVRTGLFAYVTNPMQLVSAATWILMGIALGSIWVASSAVMAWIFVVGMVRWHHRHDLLKRFPDGWPEYRAHVPEWIPRWRPWVPFPSKLLFDPGNGSHQRFIRWLGARECIGLIFSPVANSPLTFIEASEDVTFTGLSAAAKALNHINFAWAVFAAALLLIALPCQSIASRFRRRMSAPRLETDTAS